MPLHHLGIFMFEKPNIIKTGIIFPLFLWQCLELRIKYRAQEANQMWTDRDLLKIPLIG